MNVNQVLNQAKKSHEVDEQEAAFLHRMVDKHIRMHGPHAVEDYLSIKLRRRIRLN